MDTNEKWLQWAVELQSLAQAGLTYGRDVYDKERYERIREISAEIVAHMSEFPLEKVKDLFCNESGYQTPKLDTRAAIFEDGEIAAYTASFPDMLDGKRVWWASTLYCYPQFAGRGYGMIVVGSLMEAHEPDLTYDRWGAQETVEIFNHFGYQTIYTKRYHLTDKKIDTSSLKGKLAYCAQELKKFLKSFICQPNLLSIKKRSSMPWPWIKRWPAG